MKDRRRREALSAAGADVGEGGGKGRARSSASTSLRLRAFVLLCCALFSGVAFSTFRIFGVSSRPVLISRRQNPTINAVATEHPFLQREVAGNSTTAAAPLLLFSEVVSLPDQVLVFLKSHISLPSSNFLCLYYFTSTNSSLGPDISLAPIASPSSSHYFIRCPLVPHNFSLSLSRELPPLRPRSWDHIAYSALFDIRDNTTIIFAKGLNLRAARLAVSSRYECVFGWSFSNPKYLLNSPVVSAAQEIIRCLTPPGVLRRIGRVGQSIQDPPLVTVRTKGRGSITLPTVARLEALTPLKSRRKEHSMCVCTMVRNQARFLREWIIYHTHIGVKRWFIYDNNSDDDIEQVIESLVSAGSYNVSIHSWPWVKTQEAGFAHCALRAANHCDWVGFIDVDEFLYLPTNLKLIDVLRNYSSVPRIGELRTACYSFGPSGRRSIPTEGVMMGYTCRMNAPERHKSIVRPEALNPSLINVVHHFHLKEGMKYVNLEKGVMVVNHYKFQVWEVFKEKFYRRVATYVADWQDEENVGSKDRAPGLGTKAVEPPDWSRRFCEVRDTGLRDWVLEKLIDAQTGTLPW